MVKYKTVKQRLAKLIKDLDDVECAIIYERLWSTAYNTIENKESITEQMQNSIISPTFYIRTMEKVMEQLNYNNE